MSQAAYQIVADATEDILDEADALDEAVRIARARVAEGPTGELVSITHRGRAVRQLVRTAGGVAEEVIGEPTGRGVS